MEENTMKVMQKQERVKISDQRKCRVITCIHCVNDRCTSNKCDMFEKEYIQEG